MADHRHKRDTDARRKPQAALVAGPLAVPGDRVRRDRRRAHRLLREPDPGRQDTSAAADLGGVTHDSRDSRRVVSPAGRGWAPASRRTACRQPPTSQRGRDRGHQRAVRGAHVNRFSGPPPGSTSGRPRAGTPPRSASSTRARRCSSPAARAAAGPGRRGRRRSRWVTSGYLSGDKPVAAAAGLSMAPCPDPRVRSAWSPDAVYVYRSVCHAFPQITSYGGWDAPTASTPRARRSTS